MICRAGQGLGTPWAVYRASLPWAVLVYFGKVHAVGVLQPGDLPCVVLHFQVRRHDRNVDRLTLRRVGAFGANAVKFHIPVMGLHEFVDDSVHSFFIVLGVGQTANHSKTLELCLVSTNPVTLPA
jgi:hypothetical protein